MCEKKNYFLVVLCITTMSLIAVKAQSARVFGVIRDEKIVRNLTIATVESDDGSTFEAVFADDISWRIGDAGWFDVEMAPSDLSAKYNFITQFTEIPDYGWKVGYMYNAAIDSSTFSSYIIIDIDGVLINANKPSINGDYYSSEYDILKVLKSNLGCIKYKVDNAGLVTDIASISKPEYSVENAIYNDGFENLKYDITDDTIIAYPTDRSEYKENRFTEFKNGSYFSFDVMSYDRYGNARLAVIKNVIEPKIDIVRPTSDNRWWKLLNHDGLEYESVQMEITEQSSNDFEIVQYDYDYMCERAHNGIILNGVAFENAEFNQAKNTFDSVSADKTTFVRIEGEGNFLKSEKMTLDESMLYSGKIYTSLYGQKIVQITGAAKKSGLPIVKFDAYESKENNSKFRVTADYTKNGFDKNGTIYIAVYCGTKLDNVFTYRLQDNENCDDFEICADVYYKPGTSWLNYSVVGYVWLDDMTPLFPKSSLDIDYR